MALSASPSLDPTLRDVQPENDLPQDRSPPSPMFPLPCSLPPFLPACFCSSFALPLLLLSHYECARPWGAAWRASNPYILSPKPQALSPKP